jgi:hypothetical protein
MLTRPVQKLNLSPQKSRDTSQNLEVTGKVLTSDIAIHANQNQDFSIVETPSMEILDFPVLPGEL